MFKLTYTTIAPTVTVQGTREYRVEFWNGTDRVATELARHDYPATVNVHRYVPWTVRVYQGEELLLDETHSLHGKNVYVEITSGALGDTIAWMPYVEEFRALHGCDLAVSTAYNELLAPVYPKLHFIAPGTDITGAEQVYHIGWYGNGAPNPVNPVDCRTIPLQQVAADVLGLPYTERRPNYVTSVRSPLAGKYVCIAPTSTMQFKYWNNTGGWQQVVDHLTQKGYRVAVLGAEPTRLRNVVDCTGSQNLRSLGELLQHAYAYVGLPSGLTWLAWAYQRRCVMVSGISESFCEFQQDMYRVSPVSACHGCFNDPTVSINPKEWFFCPRHKGTPRQFECTKSITPHMVIQQVTAALTR